MAEAELSSNWTAFLRTLLPSPERDGLLRDVERVVPDSCYASVAVDAARLHGMVRRTVQSYARRSGVAKLVAKRLHVTLSDVVGERTGGACTPSLPPRLSTAGFLLGTLLVSGPAQRIRWWQPHPAAAPDLWRAAPPDSAALLVEPASLLLHHVSMRHHAEPATDSTGAPALWIRFLVWCALPDGAPPPRATPPTPRFRDTLLPLYHSPVEIEPPPRTSPPEITARHATATARVPDAVSDAVLDAVRLALAARVRWASLATAPPVPSSGPSSSELCLAKLWSHAWPLPGDGASATSSLPPALLRAARRALVRLAATTGARRAARHAPLLGARVFALRRGQRVGPQRSRHGAHTRVLWVLHDGHEEREGKHEEDEENEEGEEVKGKGKGEVGGPSGRRSPLELWLLDPRAPALRLEAFGGATAWSGRLACSSPRGHPPP